MALGFTQPLTEMSTRRSFWGKVRPVSMTDNLAVICEPIVFTSHNFIGLHGLLLDSFTFSRPETIMISIVLLSNIQLLHKDHVERTVLE
jgi:hypothetical protein